MSTFAVEVVRLDDVLEHGNADALELAVIGGYRAVVQKNIHKPGDMVVYVPEQAVLPDDVIEAFGFTGKLAGAQKNRVKAIKLRGELSQGLVLPLAKVSEVIEQRGTRALALAAGVEESDEGYVLLFYVGTDLKESLGITKYEEPIPVEMAGKISQRPDWFPKYIDIENIKKFNRTFVAGEHVVVTEKIHGTNFGAAMHRDDVRALGRRLDFISDALRVSSRNHVLERDPSNLYWRAALQNDLAMILRDILAETGVETVVVYGEVFGAGVQDLGYGVRPGEIRLRWFDLMLDGKFVNEDDAASIIEHADFFGKLERVPVLYRGPFSEQMVTDYTSGKDTIAGVHVREGIVIKPVVEREGGRGLRRVILKSISESYLLRANGTERH